jgi:selenium metabolism protein YedF
VKYILLDCCGLNCPQPVINTKEALEQGRRNLEVLVDNEASRGNVTRFARSQGCEVTVNELDRGVFQLIIAQTGDSSQQEEFDPDQYSCDLPAGNGLVYVISSASMGQGSDELGWALLQTYIQTIKDISPLPTRIIFYNEGVRLVAEESGALDALQALQDQGVEISACGTCLDYYKLTSAIKVGHISNMYDIMSAVNSAAKVASPL